MENKKDYIEQISELLSELINNSIQASKDAGLLDASIKHEYTIKNILNIVYDFNIINTNDIKSNYPGIDLVDETNNTVYQITSQQDKHKEKINKTIKEIEKNDLIKKHSISHIAVIFLTKEKISFRNNSKETWEKWAKDHNVFLEYYNLDELKTKIINKLKKEHNDEKIYRLLQYLQINNKKALYTFEINKYYKKIYKNLQNFTTSNLIDLKKNVDNFMLSDTQILLIKAVQGHGKSHFINYLAENSNFNWHIPALITNTSCLKGILDYFNAKVNWVIIIDDIDRYEKDFIQYMIDGIQGYDNIKLIFTCRQAYEFNIENYSYTIQCQELNIKWEEKHIDELINKYKEIHPEKKLSYYEYEKIKYEANNNPYFILYFLDNNLLNINECRKKNHTDIVDLIKNNKHIKDETIINEYLIRIGINIPFNCSEIELSADYENILELLCDNDIMYRENNTYRYIYDIVGDLVLSQALIKNYYENISTLFNNITYNNALNIKYMANYLSDEKSSLQQIEKNKLLNKLIKECNYISLDALEILIELYPEFCIKRIQDELISIKDSNDLKAHYTRISTLIDTFANKINLKNHSNILDNYIDITFNTFNILSELEKRIITPDSFFKQVISANEQSIYLKLKSLFYNKKSSNYRNYFFIKLVEYLFSAFHCCRITNIDKNLYTWFANIFTSLVIYYKQFYILNFFRYFKKYNNKYSEILISFLNKKIIILLNNKNISLKLISNIEYTIDYHLKNNIIELYDIKKIIYSNNDYLLYRLAYKEDSIKCFIKPEHYLFSLELLHANKSVHKVNNKILADYYIKEYETNSIVKIFQDISSFNYNKDIFLYILKQRQDVIVILKDIDINIINQDLLAMIATAYKKPISINECKTLNDFFLATYNNRINLKYNLNKYILFLENLNQIEKINGFNFLFKTLLEITITINDTMEIYQQFIIQIEKNNLYTENILNTLLEYLSYIKVIEQENYLIIIKEITLKQLAYFFNFNNISKPYLIFKIFHIFDINNNDIIDFTSNIVLNDETVHSLNIDYYSLIITSYEKFSVLLEYLYNQYNSSSDRENLTYTYYYFINKKVYHQYISKYIRNTLKSKNINRLHFLIQVFSYEYVYIQDLSSIIKNLYSNNPSIDTIITIKEFLRNIGTTELERWKFFLSLVEHLEYEELKEYIKNQISNEIEWHKEHEKKYYERPYKPHTEPNHE